MLQKKTVWPIFGGVAAAIGASLCCVGPLILLSIGISGAWISNLTALDPYRPIFIFVVFILFVIAGWQLYQPLQKCKPGSVCAVPASNKYRKMIFVVLLIFSISFVSSPYWLLFFV